MVKQFAFALGVTTCLASIDLAHSKASNILFSEALDLEGSHPFLRKSDPSRMTNSKQGWLLTPQTFERSGVNHRTLFDLGKNGRGLISPHSSSFSHLNRLESPIASRPFFGNVLFAHRETHAFLTPTRSSSLQRLLTTPATLPGAIALPFLTSIKAPAPRQLFPSNITVTSRTTHAFLAHQRSTPFQRLLTAPSVTPSRGLSASLLSQLGIPETHQLSLGNTFSVPRNTALMLRPQSLFTAPITRNIVEESTISLKEAIDTLTKPVTHSPVPITPLPSSTVSNEISFASIIKNLVSTESFARVSSETQPVTPSLREETRERDAASIVSESPSSLSHDERSLLRSPQEDGTQTSFSLTTSTPLEQEERSSHLSVEKDSTSLLSDSSLSSSPLKKEQLREETIQRSPSVFSAPRFSSQSERQEQPEVSLSEQSSESFSSQEHNPISEESDRPLDKNPVIESASLVTNREVAPVIAPSEDNETEIQSALMENDTTQRSQSKQALEEQHVQRETEERLKREHEQEEQERLEQRRREKLEWAQKEQLEWDRIEAQHLERKQKRIEEQRLLDQQRVQRETEERLQRERIQAQRLLDEQRLQRENEERLERERVENEQLLLDQQRVQRETEERLERERIQAQRLLDEQRVQRENQEREEQENRELLADFIVVGDEELAPENVVRQQPQIPVIIDNYQPPRQNDAPPQPLVVQQQPQARGGLFGLGWGIGGVQLL